MAYDIKKWKNMPSMTCMTITPEMAQDMLDRNYEKNRNQMGGVIASYAEDMKRGFWKSQKSSPIVFTKDGILIDGQHRLRAIIEAGLSIPMWVICDAKLEDFDYIDNNTPRGAWQFLDVSHQKSISALAGFVTCIKSGSPLRSALNNKLSNATTHNRSGKGVPTRAMIMDCVANNKDDLLFCVRNAEKIRNYCGQGSLKEISAFVWTMLYLGKDARLGEFIASFNEPGGGHQANLFRIWMLKLYAKRVIPHREETFKHLLEAYDDFCENKKKTKFVNFDKLYESYNELIIEKQNEEVAK